MGEYEKCFGRFLHSSSCSLFLHGLSTLESSRSQWVSHTLLESASELPRIDSTRGGSCLFLFLLLSLLYLTYYILLPELSTQAAIPDQLIIACCVDYSQASQVLLYSLSLNASNEPKRQRQTRWKHKILSNREFYVMLIAGEFH